MTDEIKYENIAVPSDTKKQFMKQYQKAKKGKRHFYMSDYLLSLLHLEQQQGDNQ